MRKPDFHVHSYFSPDGHMEVAIATEVAIEAGITDLCFTEHMDLGHNMELFNRVPDFYRMKEAIEQVKSMRSGINIYHGVEVGYIKETAEQTAKVLADRELDYVLLSTHCVDGMDCYMPEAKRGRDKETAYKRYLETVYESVTDTHLQDAYDCVGHLGYIAKCNYYEDNTLNYEMFPELIDSILLEIIKQGKGIEVNTSGINRAGHTLPHPSIIKRYYELGGRIITIGSDAHRTDRVGEYVSETMQMIKDCGFKEIAVFSKRKPIWITIEE